MMQYIVTPQNKFKRYPTRVVGSSNPKKALADYLSNVGISYNKIVKMTNKELQKLYDKGLEPLQVVNYIDFIVGLDDVTSPSSGGMYKLE